MKRCVFKVFVLTIFLTIVFGTFSIYAYTRNTLTTHNFSVQTGIVMFTDVHMRAGFDTLHLYDNEYRNIASPVRNARVRHWDSNILYAMRAPELTLRFGKSLPAGTEFHIRLHNLTWFFRSVEERYPYIIANNNYSDGIEILFPSSYNRNRGLFVPTTIDGIGGVYTRMINPQVFVSDSAPIEALYELIICDYDDRLATVRLLNDVNMNNFIRIPIVARLINPAIGASVEVIGTVDRSITSGIYRVAYGNYKLNLANSAFTRVPFSQTGSTEISIPEIVITENMHGIIRRGSLILTAPEGFIIVPDAPNNPLTRISQRTLLLRDHEGEPVVNIRAGGGLFFRNIYNVLSQAYVTPEIDFRLRYQNPGGVIDASTLIVEFRSISESSFRNPGYVVISGLKLIAVDDFIPGSQHMKVAPFTNMDEFVEHYFYVGTVVGE